jgi:MFS family permease
VREPRRRDLAGGPGQRATRAETRAFFRQNARTLLCHHFGVAFIVAPIYGLVNWLPAYFVRIHHLPVPTFSVWYGIGGGIAGTLSAISVGYVASWLKANGHADATYRTMLIGGIGITIANCIAPLLPTPVLAMAGYVIGGIFVNYTPSQALAAIAEMTPNQLRGFVTSIYILVVGIAGAGLGPYFFGLVTDHVFADPTKIHYSMALVTALMGTIGIALIAYGLKAFRGSPSRVTWDAGTGP